MAKGSGYVLSLDVKSKQIYKVKVNRLQRYDLHQMKKEELSQDISKFPPAQWYNLIIVNYFLFSLSLLTKEESKAYKSLESYNQFVSGWVKEVKIRLFYITCWNCLGYWTGLYVMYFLHSTVLIGALCLLLRLKSWRARGASRPPAFIGNCPTVSHKCQPYLPSR